MKKLILALVLTLAFTGCGRNGHDGTNGVNGTNGSSGTAGLDGTNGNNGHDSLIVVAGYAADCLNGGVTVLSGIDLDDSGTLDLLEVTSSAKVCNGSNGLDGSAPLPSAFTPVAIVDPCGDKAGIYDEVFLRLQNGTLLASFSDDASGKNTHFAALTSGSYVTTDGSYCYFSVDSSGNLYNEHY